MERHFAYIGDVEDVLRFARDELSVGNVSATAGGARINSEIVVTGAGMNTVTVSREFQIVIPKGLREKFGLKAGDRLEILEYGNRIELIPLAPIKKMRGFLKGMDTSVDRESDRE